MAIGRIPGGDFGAFATLQAMKFLTLAGVRDPLTSELASRIIQRAPTYTDRILALRGWLLRRVYFQPDPPEVTERIKTVREMITEAVTGRAVYGDCDDVAVLAAALGRVVGVPARFVVVRFRQAGPFLHVFTELFDGSRWIEMDVTRPFQPTLHPVNRRHINV